MSYTESYFIGYNTYRFDRDLVTSGEKRSGGILIAIKNKFETKILQVTNNGLGELFIEMKYDGPEIYEANFQAVEWLCSSRTYKLILPGDYNLPEAV